MQPKKYTKPKIALLNIELELKAEKENAEIRVDNVQVSLVDDNFLQFSIKTYVWVIRIAMARQF